MPIARNGEIGISNDVHGESAAPVLMLVPGIGEQIGGVEFPDEHVEVLTDVGFRVVRVDCRDFGLSTAIDAAGRPDFDGVLGGVVAGAVPTVPYTYLDMADDLVAVADHLGEEAVHLVGASAGDRNVATSQGCTLTTFRVRSRIR